MASSSTQVDEPFISHDLENEEQRALSSGTTVGPPSKRTNSKRSIASRHSTKSQESKPPNVVVIMCVTVFLVAGSIGAGWLEWYLKFSEKGQGPKFTFPMFYADHMIIHQGENGSVIWGHANAIDVDHPVTMYLEHADGSFSREYTTTVQSAGGDKQGGVWRIEIEVMEKAGPYNLNASLHHLRLQLRDFYFGEVWVCMGPQYTLEGNQTFDIMEARYYPDIRVFTMTEESGVTVDRWAKPHTDGVEDLGWSYTTAVCWQYAKHLRQLLQRPLGLIIAESRDMSVENFASPGALEECSQNKSLLSYFSQSLAVGPIISPSSSSRAWHKLVAPLLGLTMQGFIWISPQPDTLESWQRHILNCSFVNMVRDWREMFYNASARVIKPSIPFGFVQYGAGNSSAEMRWHQTADYGVVSNPQQEDVFMAVTMDLRNATSDAANLLDLKLVEEIGRRLATMSHQLVYLNQSQSMIQEPWPTHYRNAGLIGQVILRFNNGTSGIDVKSSEGFELCCVSDQKQMCSRDDTRWLPARVEALNPYSVRVYSAACTQRFVRGVRYLWTDSGCHFKNCSIYSSKDKLPLPQFLLSTETQRSNFLSITPRQYFLT